ncbi:MAG: sigma-70 family RNA polymerase sigma factor [Ignavibacteria bacterium]|nr:sigma-70 family RNA polymerase sigma factor [Ignavibacteria bacterium]
MLNNKKIKSYNEDIALIDEVLKGKKVSFDKLVKKYYNSINNLIRKMIHERDDIEDLIQDTFVRAFNSLHKFNKEFAFSTWIYKIATNICIDYIRKRKLITYTLDKEIKLEDNEIKYEIADDSFIPDRRLIEIQKEKILEKAIDNLPKKYKDIIILRHKYDLNYYEISKKLNIPLGTVKAHLFRARELLNKYLKNKIKNY